MRDWPDDLSSGSPGADTGSSESSSPSSVQQQAPALPDTQQGSGGPQPQADGRKLQADLEEEQRRLTQSLPPPQQQADGRKLQADLEEEQRRLTQFLPPQQQQPALPQTNGKKPANPEEEQKQQRRRKKSRIQELEEIR